MSKAAQIVMFIGLFMRNWGVWMPWKTNISCWRGWRQEDPNGAEGVAP
jgi:hypothetical protein